MPLVDPPLSSADFDSVPWNEVAAGAVKPDCWSIQSKLREEAARRIATGEVGAAALEFLARLCSMMLRPEDPSRPFRPQVVLADGARSAIPDDLSGSEIELLAHLYPRCLSPELRARCADLRWELARDVTAAKVAVSAYREAARSLGEWYSTADRMRRALGIAASLGKAGEPFEGLLATTEAWALEQWEDGGNRDLAAALTEIVLGFSSSKADAFAAASDAEAKRLETEGSTNEERRFLQLAADSYGIAKNTASRETIWRRIAESHLRDGRRASASGKALVAPSHYEAAIASLRRLPGGEKERVAELRRELTDLQPAALAEMRRISSSMDISEFVKKAREAVAEKSLIDALRELALSWRPPEVSHLRSEVEELAAKTPLKSLIRMVVVDGDGRKLGERGPLDPADPGYEESVAVEMFTHASLYRRLQVAGVIDPMRQQILLEHRVTETSLAPILDLNPFIPGDRKLIFARGLHAGLHGDLLVATHLLVPQLENSLRRLLADAGQPVSSMSPRGIEDMLGLDTLLQHPVLAEMLGEATLFDLRALLIERTSANLRHKFAHGLMSDEEALSSDCMYLWWAVLRFCMFPVIYRQRLSAEQANTPDP